MNTETLRNFLLWCTIINYGILLLWFALYIALRGSLFRMLGKWFDLSDERINVLMFQGMTVYKVGVFIFNLAPLVALYIMK
jgi:hypothetical protein